MLALIWRRNDNPLFLVDLSSWEHKIEEDQGVDVGDSDSDDDSVEVDNHREKLRHDPDQEVYKGTEKFKDGILTIGCVGV